MGFKIKEKAKLLYKHNYYLKGLICLSACLTVLKKNHLAFLSSFSINWLLTFKILAIT